VLVSLQLIPEQPAEELLEAVSLADRLGFHACYSADEIYHKDAWLLLAAAARQTKQLRLGPCVSSAFLRDPAQVAQLAATLDELSSGRAEVVLGIGNIALLEQYGITWRGTRPLHRLSEALEVIRTLLDTGAIDHSGDFFSYGSVTTAARPVQVRVPLKIGAMGGPRSMELAGEISEGLHTACAYSDEALGYAATHFRAGAERAGRDPSELDLGCSLLGAVGPDGEAARSAGRLLAAFYIPSMPPALLERHGIDSADVEPINAAFAAGDIEQALAATPDELADRIVLAGEPDEWVAYLNGPYAAAGFTHALVSFADPFTVKAWTGRDVAGVPSYAEQVRLVGEQVLPLLVSRAPGHRRASLT
jgi:5,10-methylenetetrahydromethanopterin reductase